MKISVIVPVYNTGNYVRKCLASIVGQTYKDLEIILVDDGSSDGSGLILDQFAQSDSRISVIHKNNGGVSSARNAGLKKATGEYVSFIDSDDYLDPEAYERVVDTINRVHSSIIQFNFCNVIGDEVKPVKSRFNHEGYHAMPAKKWNSSLFSVCLKVIRRDLFLDNDLRFLEWTNQYEDTAMCISLFSYVDGVYCMEDVLYYRVSRPDSLLHSLTREGYKRRLKTLAALEMDLKNRGRDKAWFRLISRMMLKNRIKIFTRAYAFTKRK